MVEKKCTFVYQVKMDHEEVAALLELLDKVVVNEDFCDDYDFHPFTLMQLEELKKRIGEAYEREVPVPCNDWFHPAKKK